MDIPEVDTALFLRPTESLTVFLQQLGRGLRYHDEKDYLTVLDFIGHAHKSYRFDLRYRALMDDPSRPLQQQIEQGFPHLPAGCSIQLERVARHYVLENIRQNLLQTRAILVREIRDFAQPGQPPQLGEFLEHYRLATDDIYPRGSWSRLCVEAGVREPFADPDEERLTRRLRRLQHICGPARIRKLLALLVQDPGAGPDDEDNSRLLLMLLLSLWGRENLPKTLEQGIERIVGNPTMAAEVRELLAYKLSQISSVAGDVDLPFPCPMELHALCTRDEIMAALGHWTLESQPEMREGVLHLPKIDADLFMVTLNKTESDYSRTTMYEDYAINETLFHWQSQSTTSDTSPTGRRYIEHARHGHTILLCVREHKQENGLASPYHFLGPAEYVSHSGNHPISFVRRLKHPMPARLLRKTARLAVA